MHFITRTIFIFSLLLFPLLAKPQLIREEFTVPVFNDQFDEDQDNWRNVSTSENLFLIQDGEYLLRRKNPVNGYSIFPRWKNKLEAFSLSAALKLEDSGNEEASAGLIFMAQEDASGAFVFEINTRKQYRLKQLVGLSYKLLTGDVKSNGWVDSDVLNSTGQYNLIDIRTSKRNYDVYVNEKYLLSFTEIAYKSGDIGISVGPATKARVNFITVSVPQTESAVSPGNPTATDSPSPVKKPSGTKGTDAPSTDVLMKLIEQVANLKVENQQLRDSVNLLKKQLRAASRNNSQQEPR